MTTKHIVDVLREQGIFSGRSLDPGGPVYANLTETVVVPNAYIVTTRSVILKRASVHPGLDAEKLTTAARAAGENLYVLPPDSKCSDKKSPRQIDHLLLDAIWWTRINAEDQDVFTSMDCGSTRQLKRARLTCLTGHWQKQPAYLLDCNRKWRGLNMGTAAVLLNEKPPRHLRAIETDVTFGGETRVLPARPVRPIFYQKSGPLEYIWFNHRAAVPAVLYDNTVALLKEVTFTWHGHERGAIHVHKLGRQIGLIWPASIFAPDVVSGAFRQFKALATDWPHPTLAIHQLGASGMM